MAPRDAPTDRHDVHFLCGAAGQFMSRGPEVLALLDFEIANVVEGNYTIHAMRPQGAGAANPFGGIIDMKNSEVELTLVENGEYVQNLYLGEN